MDDDPIFDHHFSDLRFHRIGVVFDRFVPLVPQVMDMGALLPTEGCSQVLDLCKKTDHFLP